MIRLGALGDVIRCLPALEVMRRSWPEARIVWLTEPAAASLLLDQPALDQVIVFRREAASTPWSAAVREVLRQLREEQFDLCLDYHGILKSGVFAFASRAPRRLTFDPPLSRECSHFFATETVEVPSDPWRIRHFLALASPLLGETTDPPSVHIPVDASDSKRIEQFLIECGVRERRFVVLYPGASAGASWKQWPLERYRLVGQRLTVGGEIQVVIAWGPGEEHLAEEICGTGAERLHPAPATTLRQLGELLRRASLFIGPDTGPAHLAGAVGTPVLGIYGSSDAERNRPMGSGHRLLTHGPPMRPRPWTRSLMREGIEAISAHLVYDEAARMLDLF